ncbi:hypothetical protein [Xenococcus sp. PCC 7305]|nr:hypothetical protein [Xenococcus sp. PCC 7305]
MTHKAPSFAERNLFFSDRVWSWFHLVELRFNKLGLGVLGERVPLGNNS